MGLAGKHMFGTIGEQRVTFVEKKIENDRLEFLKKLLETSGVQACALPIWMRCKQQPQLYTIGVTDMVFNPTVYVFQRRLKTLDGKHIVNQEYWNQISEDSKPQYWKNS